MLVPSRGGAEGSGQTTGSWWGEGVSPLADQPNGEGEVGGHGKERRLVFFFFCFLFFFLKFWWNPPIDLKLVQYIGTYSNK